MLRGDFSNAKFKGATMSKVLSASKLTDVHRKPSTATFE
jgi:hypothetical protein